MLNFELRQACEEAISSPFKVFEMMEKNQQMKRLISQSVSFTLLNQT